MSLRTPVVVGNSGLVQAFAAIEVAGDTVKYSGGDVLIEFENGHASSITVAFAPTKSTTNVPGVGRVNVPTRSLAIAAGARGVFLFRQSEIDAYINSEGNLPITYTGGNIAMLMRALKV